MERNNEFSAELTVSAFGCLFDLHTNLRSRRHGSPPPVFKETFNSLWDQVLPSTLLICNLILLLKWFLLETNLDTFLHCIFPKSSQTVFSKCMILNISILLICSISTFWETGKAFPSTARPLAGVRFHKAKITRSQNDPRKSLRQADCWRLTYVSH